MDVSGQHHAAAALPRGKEQRYPVSKRPPWPQSRYEYLGENNISFPYRDSKPGPSELQSSHYNEYVIPDLYYAV
jgi:hypothetical protein